MEDSQEELSIEEVPTFSQTYLSKINSVQNETNATNITALNKPKVVSSYYLQSDKSETELAREHPIKHLWNDVDEPFLCEIDSFMTVDS